MILDQILADKRTELAATMRKVPLEKVSAIAHRAPAPLSLASAIKDKKVSLIAEVKKASPSRGLIRPDFDPVEIACIYAEHGATAISVLTESKYFQGSLDYLKSINHAFRLRRLPLIRKDFIFNSYQVYEARAWGADSLLLIASIFDTFLLKDMLGFARHLGMDCLVEVHDEADLKKALDCGAQIIGINNRDLRTFKVDTAVTRRLRPLVPSDRLVVSESGIKSARDIADMGELKVDAVLIGEALMASSDIGEKIRELFS
ncbi:MAG: indole-3-glycerol phosphate synthase TrpC [Dehalococcoidia bacterium]